MKFLSSLFIIALLIAAAGCKKSSQPTATGQSEAGPAKTADATGSSAGLRPVNPDDPAKAQEAARLAAVAAMRRGAAPPPPPALKLRGGELATAEVLAAYNQELLRARIMERHSPETLDELVRKWRMLPGLPSPPSGKRIVYDEVNCIIRLDPP